MWEVNSVSAVYARAFLVLLGYVTLYAFLSSSLFYNCQHVLEVGITIIIKNKVRFNLFLSIFIERSGNLSFVFSLFG